MKQIILITLLGLSLNVHALKQWADESVNAEGEYGHYVKAELFKSSSGVTSIGFSFPSAGCDKFSTDVNKSVATKINNTAVKSAQQCTGKGTALQFARTTAGRIHIVQQFKKSTSVVVDFGDDFILEFSAKGFTKELDHIKNRDEGI